MADADDDEWAVHALGAQRRQFSLASLLLFVTLVAAMLGAVPPAWGEQRSPLSRWSGTATRLTSVSGAPPVSLKITPSSTGRQFTVRPCRDAANRIIGVGPTATLNPPNNDGGGNPAYFAGMPQYSGVAALIMDFGPDGRFICSGTLLPDRRSILTAAHCVSNGAGTDNPLITTAYFYGGDDPNLRVPFNVASTAVDVSNYFVHPLYTGEVIDQGPMGASATYQAPPYSR